MFWTLQCAVTLHASAIPPVYKHDVPSWPWRALTPSTHLLLTRWLMKLLTSTCSSSPCCSSKVGLINYWAIAHTLPSRDALLITVRDVSLPDLTRCRSMHLNRLAPCKSCWLLVDVIFSTSYHVPAKYWRRSKKICRRPWLCEQRSILFVFGPFICTQFCYDIFLL